VHGHELAFFDRVTVGEAAVGDHGRTAQQAPDAGHVVAHQPDVDGVVSGDLVDRRTPVQFVNADVVAFEHGLAAEQGPVGDRRGVLGLKELEVLMIDGVACPAI